MSKTSFLKTEDPRTYQIAILGSLLVYGMAWLDFEIRLPNAAAILAAAAIAQYVLSRCLGLGHVELRSALISGLSLCLLLRTESMLLAALAAILAISSKFVIRWRNKHVFNPTNFALVTLLLISDDVWVSPGQWGHLAFFAFLTGCLGMLVLYRARRTDVTWAFLISYAVLIVGRAFWLGDPLVIPLHQMQSGALAIFAFFMISDPKTTPDSRTGRIIFASVVALIAVWVQFGLYQPNGILYALIASAPLVPLLDHLFREKPYVWPVARHGGNIAPT